ncbi:ABC transporter ATP-binding protein/permease [uncultured Clostridium sp.]|uniref:ABC transporter ATP-binding protein/permease n=1 Tax=uncultured Clostridium sp. TaxID=59620 RepID=UPI00258BB742|nr:ABC transporter ATP-binding protein [uncultured Clostridium sp.]MDU1347912.1 ABC transporter ATP-binding protein [Clostridium argentinense]
MNQYFKKYKLNIILFSIFLILSTITSLWIPKFLGNYIDSFTNAAAIEMNVIYAFLIIAIIETVSLYLTRYIRNKVSNRITLDMIKDLISRILKMPMSFFNDQDVMYLSSRVNTDSFNLGDFALKFISDGLINLITLVIVFIYIFYIDFGIGLKLIILIPLYFIIYKTLKNTLYARSLKHKEKINSAMGVMNNQYLNIKVTKINNWYDDYANTLTDYTDEAQSSFESYCRVLFAFDGIDIIIKRLALLVLIAYSGKLVLEGSLTAGKFTIIIAYFNIALTSFTAFIGFAKGYQDAKVSYSRIKEILDFKLEENGSYVLDNIDKISLSSIKFGYNENNYILENFNYEFKKGNIYCLVGKNGVGKSTLTELILGLNSEYTGKILYNNYDIKELNIYNLRTNLISYVEQEPILLEGTLLDNLTIGLKDYDINYIKEYCNKFGVDKILPNGYKDNIISNNINLSGGEKQKIAICRALGKNGDLIIMDEPTSALDLKSKEILKEVLLNIKKDKIIILITHDEEFKTISDYIVNLNEKNL